jgi:hypothetical protein
LFDQTDHGGRALRANASPVGQTVLRNAQALGSTFGQWVVKADTLDETAVATIALISHNNVKKRTGFRTAA